MAWALAARQPQSGAGNLGAPHFVEEARAAGLDHAYDGEFELFVGGGVAVFDCDGDGRPDLYLAGGDGPGRPVPQRRARAERCSFSRVPSSCDRSGQVVTGAYPIDIDGDGHIDLAVLR